MHAFRRPVTAYFAAGFIPRSAAWLVCLLGALCLVALQPGGAQQVAQSVKLGIGACYPKAVAVNPVTNRVYVTNDESGSISVLDGAQHSLIAVIPDWAIDVKSRIAVNPATNQIFVTTIWGVDIFDGTTNRLVSTAKFSTCYGLAVNPVTNIVYALCDVGIFVFPANAPSSFSFIDIPGVTRDAVIAVNPTTNMIYTTTSDTLWVVNGTTNAVYSIPLGGTYDVALTVDTQRNRIYACSNTTGIMVIDGNTLQTVQTITTPAYVLALAVDSTANRLYVALVTLATNTDTIALLDPDTGQQLASTPIELDPCSYGLACNPQTHLVYAGDAGRCSILALDGTSLAEVSAVETASGATCVATNAATRMLYLTNWFDGTVSVIDLTKNALLGTIPVGYHPRRVCVDEATNTLYVVVTGENAVAVVDGDTRQVRSKIPVGGRPLGLGYNPTTHRLYVSNWDDNTISVIDTTQDAVETTIVLSKNIPWESLAVDASTDRIYVGYGDGTIDCLDGASRQVVDSYALPSTYAVNVLTLNAQAHRLYAVSTVQDANDPQVSIIDTETGQVSHFEEWSSGDDIMDLCVDPFTQNFYVANRATDTVGVFDAAGNHLDDVHTFRPLFVGADTTANRIFVTDSRDTLSVIDGETNTLLPNLLGDLLTGSDYNPTTQLLYVANYGEDTLSVEDTVTQQLILTIKVGHHPTGVTVDAEANLIYVTNSGDNTLTVVDGSNNAVIGLVSLAQERGEMLNKSLGMVLDTGLKHLYVTDAVANTVTVLDTHKKTPVPLATIPVGNCPTGIGVHLKTHRVYVTNYADGTLSVIDGSLNSVVDTVPVGNGPLAVAVNQQKHIIMVANLLDNTIVRISGTDYTITGTASLKLPPTGLVINENTDIVYVAHTKDAAFSALAAGTCKALATVRFDGTTVRSARPAARSAGLRGVVADTNELPGGIAINPAQKQVYFCNPMTTEMVTVTDALIYGTITPSAGPHGSINPDTAQTLTAEGDLAFTATPEAGYAVDTWMVDDAVAQHGGTHFTLTNIITSHTVTVTFAAVVATHTVTPMAGANGAVSPNTPQTVNDGESCTFTATPKSGYTVDAWAVDGTVAQTDGAQFTLTAVAADHTVAVTFAPLFIITPGAGAGGAISPNSPQPVKKGGSCTFTASPGVGYVVNTWSVDGVVKQKGGAQFTLANISTKHTVKVTFKAATCCLTPVADVNGAISPKTALAVTYGGSKTFTATPGVGYQVDAWAVDGAVAQTGGTKFTLAKATADHTVTVSFKTATFTILPLAGLNGAINPGTPQTVPYRESLTLTAMPNTGYQVDGWYVDGIKKQTGGPQFTLAAITAKHTVKATFKVATFAITPSAGVNGTISPGTRQLVKYQGTLTFTATPKTGSVVDAWLVDGAVAQTGGNKFTLTAITGAHAVQVTFKTAGS